MGVEAQFHAFLISALYGMRSAPRPGRCTAEKEVLLTEWNEVAWAPEIDLDAITNRIILQHWGCID
jgi:hypothetical protein